MAQEGDRLLGSDGNVYVIKNGQPVYAGPGPNAQRPTIGTPDPTQPYKAPQAQADLSNRDASTNKTVVDTRRAQAELPYAADLAKSQADKAAADARLAQMQADQGAQPTSPKMTAQAQVRAAQQMLAQLDKQEALFRDKFANDGLGALGKMLPWNADSSNFDTYSSNLKPYAKQFMRVPGEGSQSDKDAADYSSLLPNSQSFDSTNIIRFQNLRSAANAILKQNGLGERPSNVFMPDGKIYTGPRDKDGRPISPSALPPSFNNGGPPTSNGGGGVPYANDALQRIKEGAVNTGVDLPSKIGDTTKTIDNPAYLAAYGKLNGLLAGGGSDQAIRDLSMSVTGRPDSYDNIIKYRSGRPGWKGPAANGGEGSTLTIPLTDEERYRNFSASNPLKVAVRGLANEALGGLPRALATSNTLDPNGERARILAAADAEHPNFALGGRLLGGAAGAGVTELGALKALKFLPKGVTESTLGSLALPFAARRLGDATYGGVSGFSTAPEGGGLDGAMSGAGYGMMGGAIGEGGGMAAERALRFGSAGPKPSLTDTTITRSMTNPQTDVRSALGEGRSLGLPLTLADVDPGLRSLTGAAVRRSPEVSGLAENVFLPRNRGQINRFGSAIERDLGPVGNVPQLSENLQKTAGRNARPLYEAANPQTVTDPAISALFSNGQLGDSLKAARMFRDQDATLARARGEPEPPTLSLPVGPPQANGMGPVSPIDIRTIDYMKRGLDGSINTAFTGGNTQTAMSAPFMRDARRLMLDKADAAVPEYGQARLAYGGPMRASEALEAGKNLMRPGVGFNQATVDLGKIGAGDIPQVQLGARSGLFDRAQSVRYGSNPYEAVLGTPDMESKLGSVFGDQANVPRLLRQRDLERDMQMTSNDIIGNSKTAQRGIADENFTGGMLPSLAIDGASMLAGGVPVATVGKLGLGRSMGRSFGDIVKLGVGNAARKKADALAPILLDSDPASAAAALDAILMRTKGYKDSVKARRGMFGTAGGAVGSGALAAMLNSQ